MLHTSQTFLLRERTIWVFGHTVDNHYSLILSTTVCCPVVPVVPHFMVPLHELVAGTSAFKVWGSPQAGGTDGGGWLPLLPATSQMASWPKLSSQSTWQWGCGQAWMERKQVEPVEVGIKCDFSPVVYYLQSILCISLCFQRLLWARVARVAWLAELAKYTFTPTHRA